MSRHLFIMRHAHAGEMQSNMLDKKRELTERGKQEARQAGLNLSKQNISIHKIHCSSATRTKQTALVIAETLCFPKERIESHDELYNSSLSAYTDFISRLDDAHDAVMIIGHNPTVTQLAEYLSRKSTKQFSTAEICLLKFDSDRWVNVEEVKVIINGF